MELIKSIAKACHEANRVYCQSIGDDTQVSWDDAPEWQRSSAITGVKYHLNNPNSTPADSHKSWLKEKVDTGWVYGSVKDPVAKTHPCIVNFEDLPKQQQFKDHLFVAIVKSFIHN